MIRGDRVTLRPVEERDYPLIHAWQNDPEVWWLMDYESPFSLADIAESEKRATEEGFPFIIEAEGRPIGRIGINNVRRRDRICALYVFIGERSAWGRGPRDRRGRHVARVRVLALRPPSGRALVAGGQRARAPRLRALRFPRGSAARGTLLEGRTLGRSGPHVGHARELRRRAHGP